MDDQVVVALTLGDVAGTGPELVARAVAESIGQRWTPLVIGDPLVLQRALALVGSDRVITVQESPVRPDPMSSSIACWNPTEVPVDDCRPSVVDGRAGAAARDWLVGAIRITSAGICDAIVTAPLNKAALAAGGVAEPGHTEILARECGVANHAMMLYLAPESGIAQATHGLGVAHVTLHTSIRSVPDLIQFDSVTATIRLLAEFMRQMGATQPRIGVCALNPHAGEAGLFGSEEQTVIGPAVDQLRPNLDARLSGPLPADTLLKRAIEGEFDGVVAMYHDQGHIALKLVGFDAAVNVTLGLPIIRTSPSQGTAFDIAWRGVARPEGMRSAIATALRLVNDRRITTRAKS